MKDLKGTLCIILAYFIIMMFVFCLSGCAKKTPVETAFDDVQTSIVNIKENLPEECQTVFVLEKIEKIESKIQVAQSVCEAKIKDTQVKYERSLWVLGIIILVFFAKIFIKK